MEVTDTTAQTIVSWAAVWTLAVTTDCDLWLRRVRCQTRLKTCSMRQRSRAWNARLSSLTRAVEASSTSVTCTTHSRLEWLQQPVLTWRLRNLCLWMTRYWASTTVLFCHTLAVPPLKPVQPCPCLLLETSCQPCVTNHCHLHSMFRRTILSLWSTQCANSSRSSLREWVGLCWTSNYLLA